MRRERTLFIIAGLFLPLAIFGVFVVVPYLQAIGYSFTDWRGFSAERNFVFLDNYVAVFADEKFWQAARNSLFLVLLVPVITIGLALFFASMLNFGGSAKRLGSIAGVRGTRFFSIVYFFPQVLSIAITAVLFQSVFNPVNGILNGFLAWFGIDGPVWLSNPQTALWCIVIVMVWSSVGFYLVILSAAMAGISRELIEAATLDGTTRFQRFLHVTLPGIREPVILSTIYCVIGALDGFALVQIMTVGPGGPDGATSVLGFYIYQQAFHYSNYGVATAMGVVLCIITIAIAAGARLMIREKEPA